MKSNRNYSFESAEIQLTGGSILTVEEGTKNLVDEMQSSKALQNNVILEESHSITREEQDPVLRNRNQKISRNRETGQEVGGNEKIADVKELSIVASTNDRSPLLTFQNQTASVTNITPQGDRPLGESTPWFSSIVGPAVSALDAISEFYTDGFVFVQRSFSSIGSMIAVVAHSCLIFALFVVHIFKFAADETTSHLILGVFSCSPTVLCYYVFCLMPTVCDWLMLHIGNLPHFTPHILSNLAMYYVCRILSQDSADSSQRRKSSKRSLSGAIGVTSNGYSVNLAQDHCSDRFGNEVCQLILRVICFALPLLFVIEGFSDSNAGFLLLEDQNRMILAYILSLLKRGHILSPVAWVGWSVQILLSTYITESIGRPLQFLFGLAFIRLVTVLQSEKSLSGKSVDYIYGSATR
jgi:hypothetical protein